MSEEHTAYTAEYPPRGSVVQHDHTIGLYCGPYIGMPGWGSILPEIHPGEFDPCRERIVRIAALVVVEPPPVLDLQTAEPDR